MSDTLHLFGSMDLRARKTRTLLADALMTLGARQDVEAIDISDLTAKAGIGRSTFYEHFASKDDFLVRSFVEMIAATETALAQQRPDRTDLLPSLALFSHIYGASDFARKLVASAAFPRMMKAGEAELRSIVIRNLSRLKPEWTSERRSESAVYVAAGFMGLLRWWMESHLARKPTQMQAAFERLARNVTED